MKKIIMISCVILLCLIAIGGFLNTVNNIYKRKISNKYYDQIGNIYGNDTKNQGLILQERSLAKKDNILIFGSSELGSVQKPFHPSYFFEGKKDGFQVNLIGRGYSQSIIHSVNFGALGDKIKGKKVVFILSPQWFSKKGLEDESFGLNFSKYQFYTLMFNKDIDKTIKIRLAKRVEQLVWKTWDIKFFSALYAADNIVSKTLLTLLMPYYKFEHYLLSINDLIKTDRIFNNYAGSVENLPVSRTIVDWNEEKKRAVGAGENESNNNEYLIENSYYDMYIRDNISNLKDSYRENSYSQSPEYADLKLFLDLCKSLDVKPLVVSIPVHGKWYDYCSFDKKDREIYYKKINQIVTSYGFEIADFSGYEYEEYFLKDIMHLGWKGWIYFDEAISKYYYEGK